MKKIKVISCLITIGIMALIFFFSSQTSDESSQVSRGFTMWFLNIIPVFSPMTDTDKLQLADSMSFIVRKAAHFTIYAALGMSASVSFRLVTGKGYRKIFLISTVFCMLYAVTDEFHQWFVSGRAGKITDVFIDTAGAAAGFAMLMIFISGKRKSLGRSERNA